MPHHDPPLLRAITRTLRHVGSLQAALAIALFVAACEPPPATSGDDAGRGHVGETCVADEDCDDGIFCTGLERCVGGRCAETPDPCQPTQRCDEDADRCFSDCMVERDADGDGFDAVECGGSDCDDATAQRYPGADEVCDVDDVDEDCDPSTFGVRDADDDGYPDAACCNVDESGTQRCGDDCDDTRSVVNPATTEACDDFDNDCDGSVDEGVSVVCYPDADADSFAAAGAMGTPSCDCGAGTTDRAPEEGAIDCDDAAPGTSPLGTEVCDTEGRDEDCDGDVNPDELCSCADGEMRSCGAPGRCSAGTESCVGGTWAACTISPGEEVCNLEDDDCDGATDEGCGCTTGATRPCSSPGRCATGTQTCTAGTWGSCSISPSAEICNMEDDDCDGMTDEAVTVRCFPDGDNDGYPRSSTATTACSCGVGTTRNRPGAVGVDCRDGDPTIHPRAVEVCDRIDSNCSSGGGTATDEDGDDDGFAPPGASCAGGFPRTDCNDANRMIYPGAPELCDRVDSNCSGGNPAAEEDSDGDGYAPVGAACAGGFPRTDCNDANASIHPGAAELCDRIDSDCSTTGPEVSEDFDGDGYAPLGATCSGGPLPATDCDDTRASVAPCAAGCTGSFWGGHRYATCVTVAQWTAAQAVCGGMSMDLVAISSAAENAYVRGLTSANLWLGGTDSATEGQWRWQNGTQFWMGGSGGSAVGGAYANWQPGQPDDMNGQDYAWMRAEGTWMDSERTTDRAYVCESY